MDAYTPTPADRFSFGLWTVGWQGVDVFGTAVRPPLEPTDAILRLADLGAYGISFHDNDVFPSAALRTSGANVKKLRRALADTGLCVPMVTTNLFSHPVFRDGGFTNNDREVRRFAIRKVADNLDLAAELGASTFVAWGGREGAESGAAKDVRTALDRYKEASTSSVSTSSTATTRSCSPSSRSRTSHAATSSCRPWGTRWRSSRRSSTPSSSASTRRSGTRRWPASTSPTAWPRRCGTASCSTSTSTVSTGRATTRTCASAPATQGRVWTVDILESGGYDGPRHFDFKPPRTEDIEGVWVSAAACMRNYLILKAKAAAFRSDPEVEQALRDARVDQLAVPTLADGETMATLRAEQFDPEAAAQRGLAFERLDQLALEHLYGTREDGVPRPRRPLLDVRCVPAPQPRAQSLHTMTLVAGVDSSTSATKVEMRDLDDGRVVADGRGHISRRNRRGRSRIPPVGGRRSRAPGPMQERHRWRRSPLPDSSTAWSPSTPTGR